MPAPPGAPGLLAVAGEHRNLLRAAVLLHKNRRHAGVFSDLLGLAAQSLAVLRTVLPIITAGPGTPDDPLVLIPVPPSSPRAWRSPAGELARGLAASSRSVECLTLLRARHRRHTQKSLDAAGRARNVVGAFEFAGGSPPSIGAGQAGRGGIRRQAVQAVLIDDVVTTGATLAQARTIMEKAGFTVPAAIALTRTPGPGS